MYLAAPFTFGFQQRYPRYRRISALIGVTIVPIALLTVSFASRVWHLILTLGVLYAVGGSLIHCSAILFLEEWFIRKKGFAFGIMVSAIQSIASKGKVNDYRSVIF